MNQTGGTSSASGGIGRDRFDELRRRASERAVALSVKTAKTVGANLRPVRLHSNKSRSNDSSAVDPADGDPSLRVPSPSCSPSSCSPPLLLLRSDYTKKTTTPPSERRLDELRKRVRRLESLTTRVRKNTHKSLAKRAERAAAEEMARLEAAARSGGGGGEVEYYSSAQGGAFFSAFVVPVGPRDRADLAECAKRIVDIIVEDEAERAEAEEMVMELEVEQTFASEGGVVKLAPKMKVKTQGGLSAMDLATELGVLSMISSILTGEAFRPSDASSDKSNAEQILLPPAIVSQNLFLSLATLLHNDSLSDSALFALLSNVEFCGLVNLPLELYFVAETISASKLQEIRNMKAEKGSGPGPSLLDDDVEGEGAGSISTENELLSSFVGFLKGMSARMRPETTQFFVVYSEDESTQRQEQQHQTSKSPSFCLATEEEEKDDDRPDAAADEPHPREIEFPLYARALQIFRSNHPSAIKSAAVDICVNIVRLVASDREGAHLWRGDERTELEQYLSDSSRVQCLVAPSVTRLTELCEDLEGGVNEVDAVGMRLDKLKKDTRDAADRERKVIALGDASNARQPGGNGTTMATKKKAWGAAPDLENLETSNGVASPLSLEGRRRIDAQSAEEEMKVLRERLKGTLNRVEEELQLLGNILQAGLASLNDQVVKSFLRPYVRRLIKPLLALSVEGHAHLPLLSKFLRGATRVVADAEPPRVSTELSS